MANVNKNYLTFMEMKEIVLACQNMKDFLDRKFIKDIYLIKFTTDIDIKDETNSDDYDKYVADGTVSKIYEQVNNLDVLDAAIEDALSVQNTDIKAEKSLEQLLDKIGESIDTVTKSMPKSSKGWDAFFGKLSKKISKDNIMDKLEEYIKPESDVENDG